MKLKISMPDQTADLKPRITVVGVGGAGGNAVNNMIRSNLSGVEFLVANTDAQALELSNADQRIQLGLSLTHGLGAGARPEIGRASAEEAIEEIVDQLGRSHMVFITAGMGGGTGTGAAPVIARAAREAGVLTVGVVTKPFHFEGASRMRLAEEGIEELSKHVDTLIIIPNQNLFRIANERTTFAEAFQLADDVLYSGVRGVTDLMVMPGLINLDFADIRTVMAEMGKAMMGTGEAEGEDRATEAAEAAISNPLLDDISMHGARGVLINITGGPDMTLLEVDAAANRIRHEVDDDANIIFGATMDSGLEGKIRVSIVSTGIDAVAGQKPLPMEPFTAITGGRAETTVAPAPAPAKAPVAADLIETAEAPKAEVEPVAEAQPETLPEAKPEAEVAVAAAVEEAPKAEVKAAAPAAWTFPSMLGRAPQPKTEEAFIAAPAETPATRPAPAAAALAPQAETEAAPIEAAVAEAKPKGAFTSLFDRMTGAKPGEAAAEQADEAKPEPTLEAKPAAKSGDEYLEIPTFLRRQAN
jgi:cell division protein FtsZ